MKKIYLLGKNIQKSLSPIIHEYVYEKLNINASYSIADLNDASDIDRFLNDIKTNNIYGLNITTPYKYDVKNRIEKISKKAYEIGAINCVDSKLKGYNTDCYGFIKMVQKNNILLSNKNIFIIGSGGSSKAVLFSLQVTGYKNIYHFNRNNLNDILTLKLGNNDVVINCTPKHFINDSQDFLNYFIENKFMWIDLLYTKLSTKILIEIEKRHSKLYLNGIDMLIYQALASMNIWFRKDIEKNVDFNDLKSWIKR